MAKCTTSVLPSAMDRGRARGVRTVTVPKFIGSVEAHLATTNVSVTCCARLSLPREERPRDGVVPGYVLENLSETGPTRRYSQPVHIQATVLRRLMHLNHNGGISFGPKEGVGFSKPFDASIGAWSSLPFTSDSQPISPAILCAAICK